MQPRAPFGASRCRFRRRWAKSGAAWLLCIALVPALAAAQTGTGRYGGTTPAGQAFSRGQAAAAEGDRALRQGDDDDAVDSYEDAVEAYQEAIRLEPEYEEARERLGYVLYVMDRHEEAIEVLEEGLELSPDSVPLRRMWAITQYESGRTQQAIDALQQIDGAGAATADALFILGKHFYDQQDYDPAIQYFQRYLAEVPSDAATHGALGNAYLRTEQYELALVEFRTVLELEPGNMTALTNMGDVYFASEDYPRAIEVYNQVLPAEPDNYRVWFNVGKSNIELAQYDAALAAFERVAELRDDLYQAHYFRGVALAELGRDEAARDALGRAVDLRDDHALSHYRLGVVESRLGNDERAVAALERARDLDPDEPWFAAALGDVLRRTGRNEEAMAQHRFAVGLLPSEASFHEALGRDAFALGDVDTAATSLEEALTLAPDRESARQALSVVVLHRANAAIVDERWADADSELDRARLLGIHPLETALAEVVVALAQDDRATASEALDRVSASHADDPAYRRARATLAVAQDERQRVPEILSHLEGLEASALDPRDAALLGHAAAAADDWNRALDLFARAMEADPVYRRNVALAHLRVGLRHAERDRWSDAARHFDDANSYGDALATEDQVRLEYARAVTALHDDDFDAAERRFSEVLARLERLPEIDRRRLPRNEDLQVELRLAYARYRAGDAAGAVTLLEGLRSGPDRERAEELLASAHERLALEAYEAGNLRQARSHLEQALESAPRNAIARNNLACLLYGEGEVEEAGDIFRQLAEDAAVTNALFNYAIYLDEHASDPQEAYRYYLRYMEQGGDESEAAGGFARTKEEVFGFEPEG